MDIVQLAEEIIAGRRLSHAEDKSYFLTAELETLCEGADRIRQALCGDYVELCSIINGKSGKCPENCKFCAQSAHNCTGVQEYAFLDAEDILAECRHHAERGVHRFSIVTAGRTLNDADFAKAVKAYRLMHENCDIALCGSHGLLTAEQFRLLRAAGVTRYHCNLETSRRYFPFICTTHTFEDKIACIRRAKEAGLAVCSGGIIGMGETWEDRIDMADTLAELGVCSVPINALMPIAGTPLEDEERLTEADILRTAAIFRYILPEVHIRLAAGRDLMENCGRRAFRAGVDATITGDMLTTSGNDIQADTEMLRGMGFSLEKRST